jgi:hypothetical protein
MTAMINTIRVGPMAIEAGSICPRHHTFSRPGDPGDESAEREGERPVQRAR